MAGVNSVGGRDVEGNFGIGFPFFCRRRAFLEGGFGAEMSISSSSGKVCEGVFLDFFLDFEKSSLVVSRLRFLILESFCAGSWAESVVVSFDFFSFFSFFSVAAAGLSSLFT